MDVRGLEALRALRTHGGVTAAAAVLHLTPSAVSQQLAALARDVGVPLTERVGRGLRLTAAGDALADAAAEVAVALERARSAAGAFLDSPTGTVRVSAFQSGAQLLLPGLLARTGTHPDVVVECSDADVATDAFAPLTDSFDVVVAHRPEEDGGWADGAGPARVRVVPLLREPLDVAVPVGHPLAARPDVAPGDLGDERWISVREGFPVDAVLRGLGRTGAPPRVVQRINDFHVVAALVAAGHGVALLPRYTFGRRTDVRLLPLRGVRAARRVDALLRPDRAERRVVRLVVDALVAEAAAVQAGP
ncbi:LysR family transcriptional regulator [Cellulomonas endophytica]|uniref:LysR family transcriptional regulator n=1 Tax=Cellulomonas endophytica TaxID=2494735 RepID=UPI00101013A5|nr:LysR family transcriptional regulator [Cellulomonas endophytica]